MYNKSALPWLLDFVEEIARLAGEEIMHIYDSGFSVEDKCDKTPLTDADIVAHKCIEKGLSSLEFDFPVLSEESEDIPFDVRKTWETYWLVDPLDGTKEFIKRNGEFSVNIALIHQGQPVLGLIYAPVLKTTYYAARDYGAFKKVDGALPHAISTSKAAEPYRIAASRSHPSRRMDEYLLSLCNYEMVLMGSSLKSCLVAEGKADLYPRLGLTSEWDTAACQCVVEEAGGTFIKTDGDPLRYNRKDSLLNPEFFVYGDEAIDWLQLFHRSLKPIDQA